MQEITFDNFINYNKRIGKIIIAGKEGSGKTLLLTRIAIGKMLHGFDDCSKSYNDVDKYNELGFNFSKEYEHLCFSNYAINCKGTEIVSRKSYSFNPYRLGLYDEDYETDFFPPGALFCGTEAKNFLDAYEWNRFPHRYVSWHKTMRQAKYDMAVDSQDFGDICKPFRKITNRFIYLNKECEEIKDSKGNIVGHKLYVVEWENYRDVEYFERTTKMQNCKEYVLIINMCVYENYDSYYCRLLHLKGRFGQDFRIQYFPEIKTIEDIETFAEEFGFIEPEGFYKTSKKIKKENDSEELGDLDIEEFDF